MAPSESLRTFDQRSDDAPFSARELMECWVRYWDVHTRSPAQIIRDERLNVEVTATLERRRRDTGTLEYSWLAFDTVMQQGVDRALYAAPYRWMLERASGRRWLRTKAESETSLEEQATAASSFVALVFPIITHAAFGSPSPVTVFCEAFERALNSDQFQSGFEEHVTGNINFDWLNNWSFILGEAVKPVLQEKHMPNFTSGFDVIDRGPLGSHPIFSEYLANVSPLRGHLNLERSRIDESPSASPEEWAVADMPLRDPWVLFGLPGQPNYRLLLGRHLPPPAVQFENFTIYARRPVQLRLQDFGSDETFENRMIELQDRVRRFRAAEKAVSLGLPPDAFE
jgi:hypothetical protein